jgi:hypothetical protein
VTHDVGFPRSTAPTSFQWDGTAKGAKGIIDWVLFHGGTATYHCRELTPDGLCPGTDEEHVIHLHTSTGVVLVEPGEWVVASTQFHRSPLEVIHAPRYAVDGMENPGSTKHHYTFHQ